MLSIDTGVVSKRKGSIISTQDIVGCMRLHCLVVMLIWKNQFTFYVALRQPKIASFKQAHSE